jgi:hypothetical protein
MADKQKYVLEFRYHDNLQVYSDVVELSLEELERVQTYIKALEDNGDILSVDEFSDLISLYQEPTFLTFDQLESNWIEGSLGDYGALLGVTL